MANDEYVKAEGRVRMVKIQRGGLMHVCEVLTNGDGSESRDWCSLRPSVYMETAMAPVAPIRDAIRAACEATRKRCAITVRAECLACGGDGCEYCRHQRAAIRGLEV